MWWGFGRSADVVPGVTPSDLRHISAPARMLDPPGDSTYATGAFHDLLASSCRGAAASASVSGAYSGAHSGAHRPRAGSVRFG